MIATIRTTWIPVLIGSAFLLTILAANWAVDTWGLVSAGMGLLVPAGTWFAGLALVLRDELQHQVWRVTGSHRQAGLAVLGCVMAGAGLSALTTSPALALASGLAFAVSELADLVVYSCTGRGLKARLLSNAVAAPVDSLTFLSVSGLGISQAAVSGQVLVKVVYLLPVAWAMWKLAQNRVGVVGRA